MAFWSSANVEPKTQFRWILYVNKIPQWVIKSVTKPTIETTSQAHKYFGYTYYYPGITTWNKVSVTLVDPVQPDSAATIATILRQSGFKPPVSENNLSAITKAKATQAIGNVSIRQVNAEGRPLETWTLNNPFITSADFGGSLAYDQETLTELKIDIQYDWATLNTANFGSQDKKVGGVDPKSLTRWGSNAVD